MYGWAISHKLTLSGFKWAEGISQFNENFIKGHYQTVKSPPLASSLSLSPTHSTPLTQNIFSPNPNHPKCLLANPHSPKIMPQLPLTTPKIPYFTTTHQKYGPANFICSPLQNSSSTKSHNALIICSSNVTN